MSYKLVNAEQLDSDLTAVADSIRAKTGDSATLSFPTGFTTAIEGIETGGGDDSYYDTFWDTFQQNGARTTYSTAFNTYWNDNSFKPKYDIKPTGSIVGMFQLAKITNLKQILEDCGVVLNTSKINNFNIWLQNSSITHLPCISFKGMSEGATMTNTFAGANNLNYIDKIIIRNDLVWNNGSFSGCTNLETIAEIEGEIGTSIGFISSYKLSDATVQRIIDALEDKTGADTSPILTLGPTPKGKLTEDQIAQITNKNWTLA